MNWIENLEKQRPARALERFALRRPLMDRVYSALLGLAIFTNFRRGRAAGVRSGTVL